VVVTRPIVTRTGASDAEPKAAPSPALVIPDEATWVLAGREPAAAGLVRVAAPERAAGMALPERVPDALVPAVRAAWERVPRPRWCLTLALGLPGLPAKDVVGEEPQPRSAGEHDASGHEPATSEASGGHEMAGDDDTAGAHGAHHMEAHVHEMAGHDDGGGQGGPDVDADGHEIAGHDMPGGHDMMAIVGEPSEDGLVMEAIDFELGPLSPSLPGGLVVELSLDGDVVARAEPRATLAMPRSAVTLGAPPDPLSPLSWRVAVAGARDAAAGAELVGSVLRARVAAVETERALSHAAWLAGLGRALGFARLTEAANALVSALQPVRARLEPALDSGLDAGTRGELAARLDGAARAATALARLVGRGRALRSRLRARAVVTCEQVGSRGIQGPVARAAGFAADARSEDLLYAALGFVPVLRDRGDAEARTAVRADELMAAVELARRALLHPVDEVSRSAPDAGAPFIVEGPRGPLHAAVDSGGALELSAPGGDELLELAGAAVVGLELAGATAGLVSFDLSPWTVGA